MFNAILLIPGQFRSYLLDSTKILSVDHAVGSKKRFMFLSEIIIREPRNGDRTARAFACNCFKFFAATCTNGFGVY